MPGSRWAAWTKASTSAIRRARSTVAGAVLISFASLVSIDEGVLLECYYMLWVGGWQWLAVVE